MIAQPYIDMTIAMMAQWNVAVQRDGYRSFRVAAGQRYRAQAYAIEPDASSAHYFLAAAALSGGRVRVRGLHRQSLQGDVRFADLLEQMGAGVRWEADAIEVSGPARLAGIDADLNAISDTAPTLAAIAPFASAPVHIRNVAHLRWRESVACAPSRPSSAASACASRNATTASACGHRRSRRPPCTPTTITASPWPSH